MDVETLLKQQREIIGTIKSSNRFLATITKSYREIQDIITKLNITMKPEVADGAIDFLQAFSEAGFKQAIVTHANAHWTEIKLRETGIYELVDYVEIVPQEELHKGPFYWSRAMLLDYEINVTNPGRECIAGGDNTVSDILAARQLGVQHLIWKAPSWEHFNNGKVPEGIIEVRELTEVGPKLARYLGLISADDLNLVDQSE